MLEKYFFLTPNCYSSKILKLYKLTHKIKSVANKIKEQTRPNERQYIQLIYTMVQTHMHFHSTENRNQYRNIANKLHYNLYRCNLSSELGPVNPILDAKMNSRVDRVL